MMIADRFRSENWHGNCVFRPREIMSCRILVLDDVKLIRWSLQELLTREGYEVDAASSPDEALNLASATSYRLIFADLEVSGERGKSFYDELLSRQKGAKIVILSALTKDQVEQKLGDLEILTIVEKPFSSEDIRAAVYLGLGKNGGKATG